jgi:hypothetical protein
MRALAVAAVVALAAGIASADDAPAPDGKDEARALNQTGVALLNRKDYRGALAVFKDAYSKYTSAKILLNIGTTLKALGRDAEAANTYQHYLDAADTDPTRAPEIDAVLVELDRKLARIALTVSPADAEVQFNLADWMPAAAAHLWRVAPGSFRVKARKPGFAPAERRGDATIGAPVEINIHLIEEPREEDLLVEGQRPEIVKPVAPPPRRSRLGASVGAHVDPANKGAAATVGLVITVIERLELAAGALLGPNQGGYLGATVYVLTGRWRPTISLSAPTFFSDGARVSARGALGLEIVANRHLSLVAELGVERAINPEVDIDRWSVIPSIAVHGRL